MTDSGPLHATLVADRQPAGWRGVLLRGPSKAGKSDLTLRLIGRGWRLVADDRVLVWRSGGRVWGRAPAVLRGLLEVRTVGVLTFPALDFVEITKVIDCVLDPQTLEQIPEPAPALVCGVELMSCRIDARAPSAAEKVAAFCGAERL